MIEIQASDLEEGDEFSTDGGATWHKVVMKRPAPSIVDGSPIIVPTTIVYTDEEEMFLQDHEMVILR